MLHVVEPSNQELTPRAKVSAGLERLPESIESQQPSLDRVCATRFVTVQQQKEYTELPLRLPRFGHYRSQARAISAPVHGATSLTLGVNLVDDHDDVDD